MEEDGSLTQDRKHLETQIKSHALSFCSLPTDVSNIKDNVFFFILRKCNLQNDVNPKSFWSNKDSFKLQRCSGFAWDSRVDDELN